LRFCAGAVSAAATLVLASCGPSSQTDSVEGMNGLSVQIKVTPKRDLFFRNYGDDYEFSFYFDGPMPDFKRLMVQCQILDASPNEQADRLSVVVQVLRSEFSTEPGGKVYAPGRGPMFMAGSGHNGAKCKLFKVEQ
jgi:hypothetical protein